jgi:subtilisin family serine protease
MESLLRRAGLSVAEGPSRAPVLVALVAAVLATLLCLSLADPAGADDDGGYSVPRQVVVAFEPGVTRAGISNFNDKFNTRAIQGLPGADKIYLLRTRNGVNPARLAARMRSDARVVYAEPNFRAGSPEGSRRHRANPGGIPAPSSDAAKYQEQYAVDNLNLTEAHQTSRGAGTVVAVIDTGVQSSHPELAGRTTAGYDFVDMDRNPADVGDGRDNDFDSEKDEMVGHGTHVAGIIALAAPEAKIMPIRALDSEGRGSTFLIARAITFATRNGADVINLSLGTSRETELLDDLADDDDDGGRDPVFVAAAGNDDNAIEQHPAAEEDVVAVSSVDREKKKSDFANFSGNDEDWVTVAAPGTNVHAPFPQDRYAVWSGTSMATPFVAGQAALIRSVLPQADAECAVDVVGATAQSLDASDPTYGSRLGGHADAGAAVEYARAAGCSTDED